MRGTRQHVTCSSMLVCLRCPTLVDTNVLLYVLCCYVQGRLKAIQLCLRYVDTVAIGAWFVPSSRCARRKKQVKKQRIKREKKQKEDKEKVYEGSMRKKYFPRGQLRAERGWGRVLTYFDRVGTVGMERDYSWSFVPFQVVCVHPEFPGNRATDPNRK